MTEPPAWIDFLARRRRPLLLVSLALVVLAGAGVTRLRFDVSNQSLFKKDDPDLVRFEAMQREFGSDEVVYLLFEPPGEPLSEPAVGRLLQLGRTLRELPFVDEVRSPLHSSVSYLESDTIVSRSYEEAADEPLETWRPRLLGWSPFRDLLLSRDGRSLAFLLRIDRGAMTPAGRAEVTDVLLRLVDELRAEGYPGEVVGTPILVTLQARILGREVGRALIGGLLVAALLLYAVFRAARAVLAPLAIVFASALATFGLMGWLDVPLSTLSPILVTVVICAGIADAVHLLASYERLHAGGLGPEEALVEAIADVFWPCLFTTLTTVAGFLALVTSALAPVQNVGWFTALGGALAFVLLFTATPALLIGWRPTAAGQDPPPLLARVLLGIQRLVTGRPRLVFVSAIAASALAIPGVARLYVDQNFLLDLPEDEPLRRQLEFVHARMGGTIAAEILIESEQAPKDGTPSAELLRRAADFEQWLLQAHPRIRAVESVSAGLREVHRLFDGPLEVPATDDLAAQLLFVLQSGDPDFHDAHLSRGGRTLRLTLRCDLVGSRENREMLARIEAEMERRFAGLARCHVTGSARLLTRSADYILDTQRQSFGLALLEVLLLIAFWTREVRLGVLSILPNVLPIAFVLGLAGWAGISITVMNALIATMAMGLIVDDTIHLTYALRTELAKGDGVDPAIERALLRSGRSVMFTTLVLVGTFAVYLTSSNRAVRLFGAMTALTFFLAFLADVVLLPATLKLWHSRRKG